MKNTAEQQRPLWVRAGVAVGGTALALSLAGCGFLRAASHEADNPGTRQLAEKALGLGDQAARDYARYGSEIGQGVRAYDFGNTFTYTKTTGASQYIAEFNHESGAAEDGLTEDEVSTIQCTIKVLKQTPAGLQEVIEGSSVLQRGNTGEWVETVTSSYEGGPPDVCDLVLSALPGATPQ